LAWLSQHQLWCTGWQIKQLFAELAPGRLFCGLAGHKTKKSERFKFWWPHFVLVLIAIVCSSDAWFIDLLRFIFGGGDDVVTV
jgi:hypothetical protein